MKLLFGALRLADADEVRALRRIVVDGVQLVDFHDSREGWAVCDDKWRAIAGAATIGLRFLRPQRRGSITPNRALIKKEQPMTSADFETALTHRIWTDPRLAPGADVASPSPRPAGSSDT